MKARGGRRQRRRWLRSGNVIEGRYLNAHRWGEEAVQLSVGITAAIFWLSAEVESSRRLEVIAFGFARTRLFRMEVILHGVKRLAK